jgi:acetyl-CoA C-acetyltransferase
VAVSPRTAVIIGVGQITDHPGPDARFASRPTPLDLMVRALSVAAEDTGATGAVLASIDELIAIGSFTWHPRDPARLVAEALGLQPARTRLTPTGGNIPQKLVHELAGRIERGEIETAAVVGAEAMHAASLARREGVERHWPQQGDDVARPELVEDDRIPFTTAEYEAGLTLPVEVYPLFENARRARLGWTLAEQRQRLGTLWSHFASVAADNPYAWLRTHPSPEVITTPTATNRMVAYPYTKYLVANLPVDMGAAYIITSLERARALGVGDEQMVFPLAGADATDHWFVSDRLVLDDSPAMRAIWSELVAAGTRSEDLAAIDLYSCFPTVVQTAGDVIGLDVFDPGRVPTLTGGLTFGGGPGNNYVTHAIAAMVDRLRGTSDTGLVTGLGWFSTKHAWGTYRTTPPDQGFRHRDVQAVVDAQPRCPLRQADGTVVIESYTVTYDRDGAPARTVIAGRFPDGARTWASSRDGAVADQATHHEIIGTTATVTDGVCHL